MQSLKIYTQIRAKPWKLFHRQVTHHSKYKKWVVFTDLHCSPVTLPNEYASSGCCSYHGVAVKCRSPVFGRLLASSWNMTSRLLECRVEGFGSMERVAGNPIYLKVQRSNDIEYTVVATICCHNRSTQGKYIRNVMLTLAS
jgi:hypothetical protein